MGSDAYFMLGGRSRKNRPWSRKPLTGFERSWTDFHSEVARSKEFNEIKKSLDFAETKKVLYIWAELLKEGLLTLTEA